MQPELHAVTDAVCCLELREDPYSSIQMRAMHYMPYNMHRGAALLLGLVRPAMALRGVSDHLQTIIGTARQLLVRPGRTWPYWMRRPCMTYYQYHKKKPTKTDVS